ncbi:hypothetical protein ETB97_011608 [Aspergillus alliaceus]|uniref:Uncharacterized protein n=1 Tax=Petromyces alliaceus TaxID=209559 RepID=A0A8H6A4B4_PETAA|nr:hypothetical protein ETB97_011608 [Aspergillus burnettii]
MGLSVSGRTAKEYVNFGVWLELRSPDTGEWEPSDLTCCHCILSYSNEGLSEEELLEIRDWKLQGLTPKDCSVQKMLQADCPSLLDVNERIKSMEKRRSNVVNMSPRDKKSEEHYALGTVYAASGFRVKKFTTFKRKLPTITDWTLIRPFRGWALKSNNFKGQMMIMNLDRPVIPPPGDHLDEDTDVYKCDQLTDITMGKFNSLRTV